MEERGGDVRDVSLLYLVLMCRSWRTVTRVRKIPLFGEEKVELHINKIQLV